MSVNKWSLLYSICGPLVLAQSPTKQNLRQSPGANVLLEDIIPRKQDWGHYISEAGEEGRKEMQGEVLWNPPQLHKKMCSWLVDHVSHPVRPYGTTTSWQSCWRAEGQLFICQFLLISYLILVKVCPFALSGYVTVPSGEQWGNQRLQGSRWAGLGFSSHWGPRHNRCHEKLDEAWPLSLESQSAMSGHEAIQWQSSFVTARRSWLGLVQPGIRARAKPRGSWSHEEPGRVVYHRAPVHSSSEILTDTCYWSSPLGYLTSVSRWACLRL